MKNKKVLIIAEAGVNHNGNLNIAKKMVTVAKNCGADYIKFQSFTAKKLVTKSANQAPYQKANILGILDPKFENIPTTSEEENAQRANKTL